MKTHLSHRANAPGGYLENIPGGLAGAQSVSPSAPPRSPSLPELFSKRAPKRRSSAASGFTMVELLISSGLLIVVLMALVYAQVFGLREDELVESTIGASDESRQTIEKMARDIRGAAIEAVGNYSGSTFTPIGNGNAMIGNAIQLYLSSTNTNCIIYYYNTNTAKDWLIYRVHSGQSPMVVASNLQNSCTFSGENYAGVVQSNALYRMLIHCRLDFCEFQYPKTKIGTNYYYDRYVVDLQEAPHVPEQ